MGTDSQVVSAEKPLQGAVLCCTSIPTEERQVIADLAEQMGAEHELDLTSRVTHLLVGESGSEKYRFVAKHRGDVKVLLPAWVRAVRERWIADEPLDMNALEAQFKLPTLYGLKICITGFEDYNFRNQLQKNVQENGGIYTGELTKENTHLIAAVPEGKKYEYANLWRLKIVSLKWYQDTLERGMQLDETRYHPSLPAEQQGLDAWVKSPADVLGKRQREEGPTREASRKLRRTASVRLGSQSDNIWSEIGRNSGEENHHARGLRRTAKSLPNMQDAANARSETSARNEQLKSTEQELQTPIGFLDGCHFLVRGFDAKKLEKVHSVLYGHGGTLHSNLADLLSERWPGAKRYVLVSHEVDKQKLRGLEDALGKVELVTELWLEWCMTLKETVPVAKYPLGGVLERMQVPLATRLVVNVTGFQGIQVSHVAKILSRLGIVYDETFTPKTNLLICSAAGINAQKVIHAKQWQIPIISDNWLWKLLRDQRVPAYEPFLLHNSKSQTPTTGAKNDDRMIEHPKAAGDGSKDQRVSRKFTGKEDSIQIHHDCTDAAAVAIETGQNAPAETTLNNFTVSNPTEITENTNKKPLQEISPNLSPRKPSEPKKKLFRTLDGTVSASLSPEPPVLEKDTDDARPASENFKPPLKDHSDLVAEFLHLKAQANAKAQQSRSKSKNLLNRALSNISNSSRTSAKDEKQKPESGMFSRTSSINSLNTDGLGTELSSTTRPVAGTSLDELFAARPSPATIDLLDPNLCRDVEFEPSQHLSQKQVTYADSAEAIALKAKLAEKRRARGRLDQSEGDLESVKAKEEKNSDGLRNEERSVLKDDEIALGMVDRRLTRGQEKLLEELDKRDSFFA